MGDSVVSDWEKCGRQEDSGRETAQEIRSKLAFIPFRLCPFQWDYRTRGTRERKSRCNNGMEKLPACTYRTLWYERPCGSLYCKVPEISRYQCVIDRKQRITPRFSNFKFTKYKSRKLYADNSAGEFAMSWEKIRKVYYENYIVDRTSFYKNTTNFLHNHRNKLRSAYPGISTFQFSYEIFPIL